MLRTAHLAKNLNTKKILMGLGTWLTIIVVTIVAIAIIHMMITSSKKKAMDDHLILIEDFSATQKVMGIDGKTGIALDEQSKKICLVANTHNIVTTRVFTYNDLLSSEIFEDGTTITKTVRTSQIGGALIGGLALGGVGAIIGGLSGKSQTSDKVKRVDFRLTVNDTKSPLHDVNFLNLETKKDGFLYKQAIQQARHWHGLIEVLVKRADLEDRAANANATVVASSGSVADELKKLAELLDAGALSIDEFQQQKSRLLNT